MQNETEGVCPRCGDSNSYSSIACSSCGSRLPWANAVSVAHKKAVEETAARAAGAQAAAEKVELQRLERLKVEAEKELIATRVAEAKARIAETQAQASAEKVELQRLERLKAESKKGIQQAIKEAQRQSKAIERLKQGQLTANEEAKIEAAALSLKQATQEATNNFQDAAGQQPTEELVAKLQGAGQSLRETIRQVTDILDQAKAPLNPEPLPDLQAAQERAEFERLQQVETERANQQAAKEKAELERLQVESDKAEQAAAVRAELELRRAESDRAIQAADRAVAKAHRERADLERLQDQSERITQQPVEKAQDGLVNLGAMAPFPSRIIYPSELDKETQGSTTSATFNSFTWCLTASVFFLLISIVVGLTGVAGAPEVGLALALVFVLFAFFNEAKRARKSGNSISHKSNFAWNSENDDKHFGAGEWLFALVFGFLPLFGVVLGAVWAIQGRPKGVKMIGASFVGGLPWLAGIAYVTILDAHSTHPVVAPTYSLDSSAPVTSASTEVTNDNLAIGSTVAVPTQGGSYELATIDEVHSDNYNIHNFQDEGGYRIVNKADVIPVPAEPRLTVNDHVLANRQEGTSMYPGIVTQFGVNSDGVEVYTVQWDDGATSLNVPAGRIVKFNAAPATP